MNTSSKYTVAEFFCGCGGFSHGFSRTGKFLPIFGNDIKTHALDTFQLNHTVDGFVPVILRKDIRTLSDEEIKGMILPNAPNGLDCLIGGPPCQGFSQMRRGVERSASKIVSFKGYNRLDQDPRNDLVLRFLEIAMVLNPKVIVIENVPQFLSHYHEGKYGGIAEQVLSLLEEMGYRTDSGVLNAADYGVPQLRQRAIIIASRLGSIKLPAPTHHESMKGKKPWVTVENALSDLSKEVPVNKPSDKLDYVSKAQNTFQGFMRTSNRMPFDHFSRTYQQQIIEIIKKMKPGETWDDASLRMRENYNKLIQKTGKTKSQLIKEGKIINSFYKKYYWSAYTRLRWDQPALTITANANFLGSGRFTHPEENRGITIREAARLQTFDDAFVFKTGNSETPVTKHGIAFDMIGEAVPPLLGRAIGKQIIKHLESHAQ